MKTRAMAENKEPWQLVPPRRVRRPRTSRQPRRRARKPETPPSMYTRESFGIVLTRSNPRTGRIEAILERSRYSYEYSEFVHGKYFRHNIESVQALFGAMTVDERLDIYSLDFNIMWHRIWLTAEKQELYHRKLAKFQNVWMKDDGGKKLQDLIRNAFETSSPARARWDFPKGRKQSDAEPDLNCAVREFEEEAGIPKSEYRILPNIKRTVTYVHLGTRYTCTYYVAIGRRPLTPRVSLRNVIQIAEVAELQWMDIEQIRLVDSGSRRLENIAGPLFNYVKRYMQGKLSERRLDFRLTPSDPQGELFDVTTHLQRLPARKIRRTLRRTRGIGTIQPYAGAQFAKRHPRNNRNPGAPARLHVVEDVLG